MLTPVPTAAPWLSMTAMACSCALFAISLTGCGESCDSGIAPAPGTTGATDAEPVSSPANEGAAGNAAGNAAASAAGNPAGNADMADLPSELPVLTAADFQNLLDEAAEADQCVVVDFWGTWCAPCMALFGPLHDELATIGDGVRPVSVAWDYEDNHTDEIDTLAGFHALKDAFVTPPADESSFMELHVAAAPPLGEPNADIAYPIVAVFGPDGRFVKVFLGGEGTIDPVDVGDAVREALADAE